MRRGCQCNTGGWNDADGPGVLGTGSGSAIGYLWIYGCCQRDHCTNVDVRGTCHRCRVQASGNALVKGGGKESRGLDWCFVKGTASFAGGVVAGWLRGIIEISLHAQGKRRTCEKLRWNDGMSRKRQKRI